LRVIEKKGEKEKKEKKGDLHPLELDVSHFLEDFFVHLPASLTVHSV
jgi:hypothetical protein